MLPLLQIASDGNEHSIQEANLKLTEVFKLSAQEANQLLPSGTQPVFYNRIGWARTYLSKSRLLDTPRRSFFKITDRGRQVLAQNPSRVDMSFLEQFEEYRQFRAARQEVAPKPEVPPPTTNGQTPEEVLEAAYQDIREELAEELLTHVTSGTPAFFERLVVELLVKMGYGGSRADAARAVGQSGDEGIDGIIDEDRLGLDTVYVQAKKWTNGTVGRPEIQRFVGALQGKRARKGIFITTATFSKEAREYVGNIDPKIVLIDGQRLVELMIDYDLGVSHQATYQIKTLDSDYFGGA